MQAGPSASALAGLLARAEAARELIRRGELDPVTALALVVAPSRAVLAAELAHAAAPRACASCGQEFTPSRDDGVYCSNACRQKAYRRRLRGELGTRREAFAA